MSDKVQPEASAKCSLRDRCHGCGAWFTLNEVRDDL